MQRTCCWNDQETASEGLSPTSQHEEVTAYADSSRKMSGSIRMGKSCWAIGCMNTFSKQSERSFYSLLKAKENRCKWIAAICRRNLCQKTTLCRNPTAPHMKSASVIAFSDVDVSHRVVTNCINFADILLWAYHSFILMEVKSHWLNNTLLLVRNYINFNVFTVANLL